ncbi:MAG TPA: hypothetical protein PLQ49_00985 [Methanothrix sp.]|nr:hypothetical protein [Methanothrix sp.]
MICEICGKESDPLFKARHRERGQVRICRECLRQEAEMHLPSSGCSCC